jgi:RNA polymerase sigma-70 factor (ECF subfamily)
MARLDFKSGPDAGGGRRRRSTNKIIPEKPEILPGFLSKAENQWKFFIQIRRERCLWIENVNANHSQHWCGRLFDEQAAQLILYGRALGLSHGEAEDVLQETFLALLQMEAPPVKARHYCVRSFRNRVLNHRRTLWRRLTREWESLRWFEKDADETPAERAAMRCLAELPVEQREAIVLKVWHGCTFEEIGGLLEISPNTAAGRYRYGLQKIKSKLEGVAYERDDRDPIAFLAAAPSVSGT